MYEVCIGSSSSHSAQARTDSTLRKLRWNVIPHILRVMCMVAYPTRSELCGYGEFYERYTHNQYALIVSQFAVPLPPLRLSDITLDHGPFSGSTCFRAFHPRVWLYLGGCKHWYGQSSGTAWSSPGNQPTLFGHRCRAVGNVQDFFADRVLGKSACKGVIIAIRAILQLQHLVKFSST